MIGGHDPNDPSIRNEPHLRGDYELDPSEWSAADRLARERARDDESAAPDDSIWDEPGLSKELVGELPADRRSYAQWLRERQARFSGTSSWLVTLGVVLATGPWAVLAAFFRESTSGASGIVGSVIIAPIVEELMKVSLPLMIVETRPYLFRSKSQILLAAIAGGACFGLLENLLYLHVYIPDPSPTIIMIRWLACLPAHTIWSLIAGIGVARMWQRTHDDLRRPDMTMAATWLIAAMILHGTFNAIAVIASLAGIR